MGLQLQHDDYYMLERFSVHSSIDGAVSGASLVLEAIVEDLSAKVNVFRKVALALTRQGVAPKDVLLASNTVSIPVPKLVNGLAKHEHPLRRLSIGHGKPARPQSPSNLGSNLRCTLNIDP